MPPDNDDAMLHDHERKIIRLEAKVEILETDQQRLKDELAVYQAATIGANKKLDAIMHALVGDESMKTTGLVQRVEGIETVTNWIKELKWKAVGALVVIGWAMAFAYWALEKVFK
ncbi:hypothetical protein F0P96_10645 [Hymenobacter busanensis]|uniref:Uncharacterized protein n=1 Tax=Hymenobacter busanensis TaxID=2607656 RepID=A0A7L4ZXB0_9BACT|nr:hypothetical protein [Hymenobacter busanensis]KAA9333419.1 hypothetical protein F0P96_10645 [Hymenobacter busanensis]QHJ07901.1 hypothetical protein GUY19_11660 [Hymenobacter busanensis]